MSIVRAPRPQGNFYLLDKRISEHKRLTWGARGLLIYLLGKPDHWRVSTAALVNETQDSRNPAGRDAVRALLSELMNVGFITRHLARAEDGRMGGYDYHVSEIAIDPAPETGYPSPVEPGSANPPQVSIEEKLRIEREQKDSLTAGAVDADPVEEAFALFYEAGMVKTGRKKALAAFRGIVKRQKCDAHWLAHMLAADVDKRLKDKQFGFAALHPTTYLNGERWNDAVVPGRPANDNDNGRPSINDFGDGQYKSPF